MDTQKLESLGDELSCEELSCEELDAVAGGDCPMWILTGYPYAGKLEQYWIRQGCPVK